jgi:ABC-type multidrug transport system fused ATPase/permease subunit
MFYFFGLVGTLAMMIKLSIHLTIACLIGAPLILVVAKISGNMHRRIAEKVQDLSAEALEIADETIQTIRTVRSFGNEEEELKRFEKTLQQSYQLSLIQAALTAAQRWFVDVSNREYFWIKKRIYYTTEIINKFSTREL